MLKSYPKYKDSGVSWIGMVPQGWEVVPLKRLCSMKAGCNLVSNDINPDHGNYHVYGGNGIRGYYNDYNVDGAVILVGRQGALCGNVHKVNGRIWATEHAIITKVIHATTCLNYLYWLLNAMNLNQYANDTAAQPGLAVNTILNIKTLLPPRPEQDAIVAYLGDKTAKIDRLIGLYKREIELLQERRQAVIHQAVTRGLDKQTKLKDSGVSWIGKVPVGWEVAIIGHLFHTFLGKMLEQNSNSSQLNSEYKPYICAKDVHFDGVDISDSKCMRFSKKEIEKYSVRKGDLLIVEGGAGAGGTAIYQFDEERMVQNSIHVVREKGYLINKYLYYWMYSLVKRDYINVICNKATIPHFTGEKLSITPIPVPPRVEQDAIVAYLDEHCSKVDAMVMQLREQMEYLDEYRSRLISDVVTGKVRV